MPRIRRSGKVIVLVLALVATSTGTWWMFSPAPLSLGQGEGPGVAGGVPLSAADQAALWELLVHLNLDRDALIALNVNQAQAQEVFLAVRGWQEQHRTELHALQAAITSGLAAVRTIDLDVSNGTVAPEELTAAQQALAAARRAYVAYLDDLRTALAAELSESQRSTWSAIAHGWGREMPVRMLALTGEQKQAYARALRGYRLAQAGAATPEERLAADAAWHQAQGSIFTPDNLEVIAAYSSYASEAAAAVAAAEAAALPGAGDVG